MINSLEMKTIPSPVLSTDDKLLLSEMTTIEEVDIFLGVVRSDCYDNYLESGGFLENWTEQEDEEHEESYLQNHFYDPLAKHNPELLDRWNKAAYSRALRDNCLLDGEE